MQDDLKIVRLVDEFRKMPAAASEPADLAHRIQLGLIGKGKKNTEIHKFINKIFYGGRLSPFRYNLEFNSMAEVIGRLGLYINDIKKGLTPDESLLKILKTHFNYSNKSKAELYAEFVIPFTSYPLRSLEFWPQALTYDGPTTKFLVDMILNAWGRDALDDNTYAQYQMSRGNIPIGQHAIQTGFTFMDTMGAPYMGVTNNMIFRKINPIIKNQIPYLSPGISRQERLLRTPGINQIRNISNFINADKKTLEITLPSISDAYYKGFRNTMRSTYMYRNAFFSTPYYFYNNSVHFKGNRLPSMDYFRYKYLNIRTLGTR